MDCRHTCKSETFEENYLRLYVGKDFLDRTEKHHEVKLINRLQKKIKSPEHSHPLVCSFAFYGFSYPWPTAGRK